MRSNVAKAFFCAKNNLNSSNAFNFQHEEVISVCGTHINLCIVIFACKRLRNSFQCERREYHTNLEC